MATLKIYKTQIVPERNFLVQDIDEYLNSLTPTYIDTNFQFVKPYLDTSIKIEVDLDTWGTADIKDTSLMPLLGNYLSITESLDNSNKTFYYYIIGAAFTAEGTVSLQISLDTVNTYSDYLYNVNNYTSQTNISRETAVRWKYDTNLRYKPVIDKYSESLDLSPDSYYRSTDKTINEGQADPLNVDWYVVYKAKNSVIASGQNASDNIVDTYLVPSEATTLVNYSYTGDYAGIEAGYDGGYEPYTADDAGDEHGIQFDVVDYQYTGAPAKLTTIKSRWQLGGEAIDIQVSGIANLVNFYTQQGHSFPRMRVWTAPYVDDQYNRRWKLYRVFMSGQSADSASSPKLYITGIYYNEALNKYFGMRGTGGDSQYHAYIFSSNTNTYVNAGYFSSSARVEFGNTANTAAEYVLFDSPSQIKLNVSGNACDNVYSGKIWLYMSQDIKSIKSYDSNTGTYSSNFFTNPATGSTTHTVYNYLEGYDTLNRSDSKLIKIIRCPYCPVKYTKTIIQNGFAYNFEGFSQASTETPNVVTLKKQSNPTDYAVDLTSNTNTLTYFAGFSTWQSAPVNINITTDYLFNDPKLQYGQDTLIRKYAFDNQVLNMPYERYDFNSEGLPKVKDNIKYMHTREIASDLLFTIKPDDANDNAESYTNYDYGNILLSSRNLEEPILNNDYLNYMRYGYNYEKATMEQNIQAQQISTGINTATSIIGGTAAGALAGAKFGGVPGAIAGAAVGLASSVLSATSKIITMNSNIDAARNSFNQKLDTLRNQATNIRSNNAVDLLDAYSGVKLKYFEYRPVDELRLPIAKLYHYCGYAHPVQEAPKWSRYWFDFIQCSPVFKDNIFKNIYGNYQQDIIYRFENGITVLHNRGTSQTPYYNWEQDKQNWETDLTVEPEIKSITVGTTKYAKTGNTVAISGTTYYSWSAIGAGIGRFVALTLTDRPSVGDTAYTRQLITTGPVRVLGEIAHVNWGV